METSASSAAGATSRLTISLPQASPLALEMMNETHHGINIGVGGDIDDGSNTAPIFIGPSDSQRPRHFSFGAAAVGGQRRTKFHRQKTISGDSFGSSMLTRAISRTYTFTSNASSSIPVDEWKRIFDKFDIESDGIMDGKIPVVRFREILEDDPLWATTVPPDIQETILSNVDRNRDNVIDYEEFMELIKGRQLPGFGRRRRRALRELLKQTVEFIVPYQYQYQNQYSCSPPPLFMLCISLLQIAIFTYDSFSVGVPVGSRDQIDCSHLIFNPDKRYQIWRYLTYMFNHSGLFHITFNILVQLILGIPLEMVHGWWRVMFVYLSGVLAGSLWTSVIIPQVSLSGASGGVYALITAHLGTVIMNFREMTCPWCRMFVVSLVAITDVAVFIYEHYNKGDTPDQISISYPAHISGALAGLLVGITCLKNLRWERHERYIWAVSVIVFVLLIGSAIVFSIANPSYFASATKSRPFYSPVNCTSLPIVL